MMNTEYWLAKLANLRVDRARGDPAPHKPLLTPKEVYLDYLERRIHSNPTFLIQPTFASIALKFQYAEPGILHTYTITRSWE
jgi:hypothetical protein